MQYWIIFCKRHRAYSLYDSDVTEEIRLTNSYGGSDINIIYFNCKHLLDFQYNGVL